jgi:hypothetical protein
MAAAQRRQVDPVVVTAPRERAEPVEAGPAERLASREERATRAKGAQVEQRGSTAQRAPEAQRAQAKEERAERVG